MRQLFTFSFLIFSNIVIGQNKVEWDGKYLLQLSDFQSSTTQIGGSNIYSLHTASSIDFLFAMTNIEFMVTKNFNSKVECSFNRDVASLVAPDTSYAMDLLNFARYEFDLSELYARKLRKRLFEEKGVFSDYNFFKPVYDENQREFTERHTIAGKITDLGRNHEKLKELHQEVLFEIEMLSDYCKLCKPPKKKK